MSLNIKEIFENDPELEFEYYHQDYRELNSQTPFTHPEVWLGLALIAVAILYQIGHIADYDLLPLPELLWNSFVYFTPNRLIDLIEVYQSPLGTRNPALRHIPRTHATKSEALRKMLGFEGGGIVGTVAQASRRLSIIPGLNRDTKGRPQFPPGLGNWDNSCYQNSILQGLASLGSLPQYLTTPINKKELLDAEAQPDMRMAESLRDLITTLTDPANNGRKIWTPAVLKNMSSFQQQDAQEYYSKVLDEIDKEVAAAAKAAKRWQGFESNTSSSSSSENSETTQYRNPLEGLIAQRVGCTKCGHSEGLSMIPFNCLTVPVARKYETDVSDSLDEYTMLEDIDGVECGKCTLLHMQHMLKQLTERLQPDTAVYKNTSERLEIITEALEDDDYSEKTLSQKCKVGPKARVSTTKTRQAVIARAPASLVVHFNRSVFNERTGDLMKNTANINFPKIVDLGPWCLGSSGTASEEWRLEPNQPMVAGSRRVSRLHGPLYELRAVVTHVGRHENGHYICYRKHPTHPNDDDQDKSAASQEHWWRLSDEDVSKSEEEDVLNQGGVFMLYYDLVEPAVPNAFGIFPLSTAAVVDPAITSRLEEAMVSDRSDTLDADKAFVDSSTSWVIPDIDATPEVSHNLDVKPQGEGSAVAKTKLPQSVTADANVIDASAYIPPPVLPATNVTESDATYLKESLSDIIALAAAIPLPDPASSDPTESEYQDSIATTDTSITSSSSELDSDDGGEHTPNDDMAYEPTKAIIVPTPYTGTTGVASEEDLAGTSLSNNTLVRV